MGLLTVGGQPMQWGTPETSAAIPIVLESGVRQFMTIYQRAKDVDNSPFLWGEELEHTLVELEEPSSTGEEKGGRLRLALNAAPIIDSLVQKGKSEPVDWRPEYGSFMVESVPMDPYTSELSSLLSVEGNIARRCELIDIESEKYRKVSSSSSSSGEKKKAMGVLLVSFPLLGVGKFSTADDKDTQDVTYSQSLFIPDICINQTHPRFGNLTRNIRLRRGRKVCIQVPIFIDEHTMERTIDKKLNIDANPRNDEIDCHAEGQKKKKTSKFGNKKSNVEEEAVEEGTLTHLYSPATDYYYAQYTHDDQTNKKMHVEKRYEACPCPTPSVSHPCVYMDCMAFGMGLSCLQVTMQLRNFAQARHVYDQLHVLCPPFLAITSATPFQKGILCDSDVRWLTIAASVDDRHRSEVPRIIKSRYDSISAYISSSADVDVDSFNDNHVEYNEKFYKQLREQGVDERLAKHVSHLFIRDPLVIFDEMIHLPDDRNEHFENIQSTNWQNVRFKPPPPGTNIGWRVEFRVMDVMPTPFENAAFSVFIVLLTRAIIKYDAKLYIPMSKGEQNMGKAHKRNPCDQSYFWRKDFFAKEVHANNAEEFCELNVDEIFNGKKTVFEGLVPIVKRFLVDENVHSSTLDRYLEFISMRAAGKIPTAAQYLRNFIMTHPGYMKDSRVTEEIAIDLVKKVHGITSGTVMDDSFIPTSILHHGKNDDVMERKRSRE